MASILQDIRAALETHLSNISGLPAIVYENVNEFDPTTGTPFIQCKFLPVTRRPAVRGLNPQQRYGGVFAIQVYTPTGQGPAQADSYADLILESFDATTDISFTNSSDETIIVSIDYAERNAGLTDNPWYFVPVSVHWYIYN